MRNLDSALIDLCLFLNHKQINTQEGVIIVQQFINDICYDYNSSFKLMYVYLDVKFITNVMCKA